MVIKVVSYICAVMIYQQQLFSLKSSIIVSSRIISGWMGNLVWFVHSFLSYIPAFYLFGLYIVISSLDWTMLRLPSYIYSLTQETQMVKTSFLSFFYLTAATNTAFIWCRKHGEFQQSR